MVQKYDDAAARRMYQELVTRHLKKPRARKISAKAAREKVCKKFDVKRATFFRRGWNN